MSRPAPQIQVDAARRRQERIDRPRRSISVTGLAEHAVPGPMQQEPRGPTGSPPQTGSPQRWTATSAAFAPHAWSGAGASASRGGHDSAASSPPRDPSPPHHRQMRQQLSDARPKTAPLAVPQRQLSHAILSSQLSDVVGTATAGPADVMTVSELASRPAAPLSQPAHSARPLPRKGDVSSVRGSRDGTAAGALLAADTGAISVSVVAGVSGPGREPALQSPDKDRASLPPMARVPDAGIGLQQHVPGLRVQVHVPELEAALADARARDSPSPLQRRPVQFRG
jgi:hypothetical protein